MPASWPKETASVKPSENSARPTKRQIDGPGYASVFDPKKYALIHFVNTQEFDPQYTPLSLRGHTVVTTGQRNNT
ncbi:uncharacterized protein N7473_010630 [Penicillium subrubescens]|uniref:uncharacterized protein n=1 Tax=Penicillium subrubescens TaxID=1316194 RepID=UPI0025450593|nr:uncharacterized protein N7473_010630 [Penicillium subrubescens]KAJ5883744.1 hypothetical protein N7473_010630 [Penicillium subrubescens]